MTSENEPTALTADDRARLAKTERQLTYLARRLSLRFESEKQLTAERDDRQARIDKAVSIIDMSDDFGDEIDGSAIRAALLGDTPQQPAESDHQHAVIEQLRAEVATARALLESIAYDPNDQTWRTDNDTQKHMANLVAERDKALAELAAARADLEALKRMEWFVGKAAESRTARTVAELTEFLVTTSAEWDDNTGDDETSRPYLEYLARAVASWRPVPAEAGSVAPTDFSVGDVVRNRHTGAVLTVRPPLRDWERRFYELVRPAPAVNETPGSPA